MTKTMNFIGRSDELKALEALYAEDCFQLFVLYGRRRVGKTTLLTQFCKGKDAIYFSATEGHTRFNLERFSECVFRHYGEKNLAPFASWEKALTYIHERQVDKRLVLVIDEFPYLAHRDKVLLSQIQHLVDHVLQDGRLFIVLSGSYMGFMEKEVLSAKSPLFGRRTGQLHLKSFDYRASLEFCKGFSSNDRLMLYGVLGGTPHYLRQISSARSFQENIKQLFLSPTAYLYEEPLLLLRQEVQEPDLYNTIIEAVAQGASKANEIATRVGESSALCLKYINVLCALGILYKETPFGEKDTARRTLYGICDLMFRFWYRYVYPNRTLIETGAGDVVLQKCIKPNLNEYMGPVFERVAKSFLITRNVRGELPFLFTSIGSWWGTNAKTRTQVEIDLVAHGGNDYLFAECKWTNEKVDCKVLESLKEKVAAFATLDKEPHLMIFSKNGFSKSLMAQQSEHIHLVSFEEMSE